MVGPSRLQYPQATDAPGSNTVDKSDAMYSNSSMDPTFLNFSQMWPVTQAWSNVPLANYHHDLPFQQDYSNNDSFIQNQQTEPPDYDGNDDFYDNEMSKSNDAANLFTEHKGNSASLAAQNKAVTPIKPLVDQAKGSATDTKKSAAELRAFLLAKKRPGSATPSIPRAYNKDDNGAKVMSSTRQEKTVEKSSKSDETNAGSVGPVTSQSTDKSIQNPSNAQSLPARNADIEGLIDEYRAPEVTKEPRVLDLSTSASETISNGKTNRAASPTTPKSITTINPVKFLAKHAASPESPESGEIHSDQEPAIRPVKPDRAKNAAETVNNQPPKSAKKKITVDDVDQRQPPKTPQIRLDASKQAALQAKPIQDSLAQATDRRRSVQSNMEPRNVPLAQRITRSRQQEIQSPSLGDTRGGNVHRQESNDKVDKRDHEHPAKTSTSVMQQRPRLPWRSMTNERPDLYKQERKQNEELAALYKRQLAEQHTASPQHNDGKRPLIEPTILHNESVSNGAPADDASAEPVETQKANDVTLSEAPSTQGAPNSLSLHQHEQIQRLGIDLSPQGLSDLHDFLEYHRFYVEEYREGFFARQKRMRALEAERFALERESLRQFDHFSSMRAQSLTAREYTEPPTPVSVARHASIETPSVKPMPPPLTLPKRNSNGGVVAISGKEVPDSAVSSTNSAARTNGESTPRDAPQSDGVNVKRRRPSDEMDLDSSRKVARVDTDLRSNGKGQDISPMTQITHDRRFSSDYRPASHDFRGRSRSPTTRRRSFSPRGRASESGHPITREYDYWAGRGYDDRRPSADGLRRDSASTVCRNCDRIGHFTTNCPEERGDSHNRYTPSQPFRPFNSEEGHSRREPGVSLRNQPSYSNRGYRGGYRGGRASFPNNKPRFGFSSYTVGPATANGKTSESLNLNARESRYFMIKSWTVEKVEAAQRDLFFTARTHQHDGCIVQLGEATEEVDVLTEAINTCRNVIQLFSVNISRAFHGYAQKHEPSQSAISSQTQKHESSQSAISSQASPAPASGANSGWNPKQDHPELYTRHDPRSRVPPQSLEFRQGPAILPPEVFVAVEEQLEGRDLMSYAHANTHALEQTYDRVISVNRVGSWIGPGSINADGAFEYTTRKHLTPALMRSGGHRIIVSDPEIVTLVDRDLKTDEERQGEINLQYETLRKGVCRILFNLCSIPNRHLVRIIEVRGVPCFSPSLLFSTNLLDYFPTLQTLRIIKCPDFPLDKSHKFDLHKLKVPVISCDTILPGLRENSQKAAIKEGIALVILFDIRDTYMQWRKSGESGRSPIDVIALDAGSELFKMIYGHGRSSITEEIVQNLVRGADNNNETDHESPSRLGP